MKKIIILASLILTIFISFSCKSKEPSTIMIGDKEYDTILFKSGYYLDKASLSEAKFVDMLSKVTEIEKPSYLGTCVFPDFANIVLKRKKEKDITDVEIEAEIEKMRDTEKTYTNIKEKRAAKLGDKVTLDFSGTMNGEPLEGGSGTDFELELGSGTFIPGFEEGVVGNMPGKKFTLNLIFPEEYIDNLAGKAVNFDVVIKSISEAVTPEVNDEFIKTHSLKGASNIDEFKDEIKEKILASAEFLNKEDINYQLYVKLMEDSTFEPTKEALAWQFSKLMSDANEQIKKNGVSLAEYLTEAGTSIYELHSSIKENAEEYIKSEILINELQKNNKIALYENDVKEWFTIFADAMGYGKEVTYEQYKDYVGYENLVNTITEDMLVTNLTSKCKIVEYDSEENMEE